MKAHAGWGIYSGTYRTLLGPLFWGDPPWFLDACRTAAFRTRREARDALRKAGIRESYKAKVVRVRIEVHVQEAP